MIEREEARRQSSDPTPKDGEKKPYRTPELTEHGTLESLTRGTMDPSTDPVMQPLFS